MVEYIDGSIIAQLGEPDMRVPIQYALYYPHRMESKQVERVDFKQLRQLTFEEADLKTFAGLKLAYKAGYKGGSMPTVYNAANEWAVARFLENRISFTDISKIIGEAMDNHKLIYEPSINEILTTERETYDFIEKFY